jgi:WD40 repeat protein
MNSLTLCALLLGTDPEPNIDPTFAPKLKWTIPAIGSDKVINATVVAISADGTLVAGGFDSPVVEPGQVAVYDRKTGDEIYRAPEEVRSYLFVSMEFSRDNRYLAVATYLPESDFGGGVPVVQLIDLKEKKRVKKWGENGFAFSPTEDLLYLTTKTHIEVLELPRLKVLKKIAVPLAGRLAVSPDGKTVAARHKTDLGPEKGWRYDDLAVIDAASGAVALKYQGFADSTGAALAFSPDGKRIATGHWKGEAWVWSAVKEGEPQHIKVETPFGLYPLWFDNETLGLFMQRRSQGIEKEETWTDMYRCDLSKGEPEAIRWRFENAIGQWSANSGRFALTADRRRMVVACNGMSVIDLNARKVERTFPGWKQLDPKK